MTAIEMMKASIERNVPGWKLTWLRPFPEGSPLHRADITGENGESVGRVYLCFGKWYIDIPGNDTPMGGTFTNFTDDETETGDDK